MKVKQQVTILQNAVNAAVVVRRLRRSNFMPGCKTL